MKKNVSKVSIMGRLGGLRIIINSKLQSKKNFYQQLWKKVTRGKRTLK